MDMKSDRYDVAFVKDNMMGPNSMKILEEMADSLHLKRGMRVLDLGCGKGLTSIFLAEEYDVCIFATDLWIDASKNYRRIQQFGLEDRIMPIHESRRRDCCCRPRIEGGVCRPRPSRALALLGGEYESSFLPVVAGPVEKV